MPTLFGRQWTPEQLRQLTGSMNQLAGIRAISYDDGRSAGVRAFNVWTGSGLTFDVLAGRSLDIGPCTFNGKSLTWNSPGGFAHGAFYEPEGLRWLRTFGGGLFVTCGLDQFASPSEENGEEFGLHGRVGNLPAEQVGYQTYWDGDDYRLEITGTVRQTRLFGENLVLRRRIRTALGSSSIRIEDEVTNEGWNRQPHMIMYHFNLGFPLISPGDRARLPQAAGDPPHAPRGTAPGRAYADRALPPPASANMFTSWKWSRQPTATPRLTSPTGKPGWRLRCASAPARCPTSCSGR